jgi:amidophosphoribosyltransferase
MRLGSPPILHSCPFLGFSASKSSLELIARRIVKELEGDDAKDLDLYATTGSEQYNRMIDCIRTKLNITTLRFNTVEDLVAAIGLPKKCVCTHCYDGTSHF